MSFHPLDPPSADEFTAVADLLRSAHQVESPGWRYTSIELVEPSTRSRRSTPTAWSPSARWVATVLDGAANATYQGRVSLTSGEVLSWTHIPGVQPNFTVDEWLEADEMLWAHPATSSRRWPSAGSPT